MNKVIWQKWADPFLPANNKSPIKEDEEDELAVAAKHSWMEEDDWVQENNDGTNYSGPCLVGPMGVVPLAEHNSPSRTFNLWVGHTNFDVTKRLIQQIECLPGVEVLKVHSRYRFWLGIGKAFVPSEVKANIEKFVAEFDKPPEKPSTSLDLICNTMRSRHKFWAVVVCKDNKLKLIGEETQQKVVDAIDLIKDNSKRILTSWDK